MAGAPLLNAAYPLQSWRGKCAVCHSPRTVPGTLYYGRSYCNHHLHELAGLARIPADRIPRHPAAEPGVRTPGPYGTGPASEPEVSLTASAPNLAEDQHDR